jgi:excisionase family DNA binding protein
MASIAASPIQKLFFTRPEFAEIIGVSPQTVINWEKCGDIAVVRVGGSVRIPRRELVRLLGEETSKG